MSMATTTIASDVAEYEALMEAEQIGMTSESMTTSFFPFIEHYSWGGVSYDYTVLLNPDTSLYEHQLIVQVPQHCILGNNCGVALGAFVPTKDVVSCESVASVLATGTWTFEAIELNVNYTYMNHTVLMNQKPSSIYRYAWADFTPSEPGREEVGFLVSAQHPTDGATELQYRLRGTLVKCDRQIGAHLQ